MSLKTFITNSIAEQTAAKVLLVMLFSMIIFHSMVLVGVIPYKIVWGGKLKNTTEMFRFETISIIINVVMLFTIIIRAGYIKMNGSNKITRVILWIMAVIFLFNTLGNILSVNQFEKLFFTPLTFVLSILSYRLAVKE